MTWGYFYCPHCGENKKSNSDLWQYDGDTIHKFCNKNGCQEIQRDIDEAEAKVNKNQAEIDRLKELKRKVEEESKKQLREAELKYNPAVAEAEEKTGQNCWGRSNDSIPITGTCGKCKNTEKIIFKTASPKVHRLVRTYSEEQDQIRSDYRCANCYCQEEGIKPKKSPSHQNNDRFKYTPPNHNDQSSLKDNCPVCEKTLSNDEKLFNHFTEEPEYKFCGTCWPQAQEHQKICKRINTNKEINIETEITNNTSLSSHSKISLTALAKVKQGEDIDIDALSLSEQERQYLREIAKEVKTKPTKTYTFKCKDCQKTHHDNINWSLCYHCRSRNIEKYKNGVLQTSNQDNNNGLPEPVKGLIVIGVIILIVVVIRKWRNNKKKLLVK